MRYWIDRFPRLLSHSYHALQSCCNEPIFSGYYPQNYAYTKPNYFYEETEDFKPFDGGQKPRDNRDSPKRYNQEYRYKPMNYPNFVMDRKSGQKIPNSGMMGDPGNYNRTNNYNSNTKKGSYNFHRLWTNEQNNSNNFKTEPNDPSRFIESARPQENAEVVRVELKKDSVDKNTRKTENVDVKFNEVVKTNADNSKMIDQERKMIEQNVKTSDNDGQKKPKDEKSKEEKFEKTERKNSDKTEPLKRDENQKHSEKPNSSKKKLKAEAATNKESVDVDGDGFKKVTKKHSNAKKQKNISHQNENVNWIIPGQENK